MPQSVAAVTALLKRPRARWWLAWGWTLLVIALMWWPSLKSPPTFLGELTDKVGHFVVFGVLSALWLRALPSGQPRRRALLTVVGGCLAFSLVAEVGQAFVPGRDIALGDLAANWTGVSLGSALAAYSLARRRTWEQGERPLP